MRGLALYQLGSAGDSPITPAEMFKIYLDIDRQILRNAAAKGAGLYGLGAMEMAELDQFLTSILNSSISSAEIMSGGLDGLSGWFSKAKKWVNEKIVEPAKKIVNKAAEKIHQVITWPARKIIEGVLKVFKGKSAKFFVYAFIPNDSPILKKNSEVKRKSDRAKKFLDRLNSAANFDQGYLLKHIRNNVQDTYKMSPEEYVKQLSEGKIGMEGLGVVDPASWAAIAAAIAALAPVIPAVIGMFGKKDVPEKDDFSQPVKDNDGLKDPGNPNNGPSDEGFAPGEYAPEGNGGGGNPDGKKDNTMLIVGGVAAAAVVGVGIYLASK